MRKLTPAEWCWVGLTAYVVGSEAGLAATNNELMTDAWRHALEHPKNRWLVIVAWLVTTKHLFFGRMFPLLDPFTWVGYAVSGCIRCARRAFNGN